MQWLASLQTAREMAVMYAEHLRHNYLLPLAQIGGQNMQLLKNGQWIPGNVQASNVVALYDLTTHTIVGCQAEVSKTTRWPWLSVVAGEKDLSDFFAGLRITSGSTISDESALMLFAHQKGWVPDGEINITLRDGTMSTIHMR